ncbi:MAG TPA: DUF3307 domain-containing protein [Flavobacterium sp.]|nr:DUF3307 domain-containing protein [Flavobacterium sp.]
MIILIKLILAHFIGDFLLQPTAWVKDKEVKKAKSRYLYAHILIHGFIVLLLLWDFHYWLLALLLMILHGVIDTIKLYSQNENNKTHWFLLDQLLHVISISGLWVLFLKPEINFNVILSSSEIWIYANALLFITVVSGIVIKELMFSWSNTLGDNHDESLSNAGKYIGMLERLFVFVFVITGNWEGIGFLLAAKSVFRFGDLKESKDRKLTEYILIGTLLSFGIATGVGMAVLKLIENG